MKKFSTFYDLVLLKHTSSRHLDSHLYHNIDKQDANLDAMLQQLSEVCKKQKVVCTEPPSLISLLPKHYMVSNQSLLGEFENLTSSNFDKIQQFMVKVFLLLDKSNFKSVESLPLNKILAEDWKVKLIESSTSTKQMQALQNEILQLKADHQQKARDLSLLLQKHSQQQESDLTNVLSLQKQCTELKHMSITQPLPSIKLQDSVLNLAKISHVETANIPLDVIPVLVAEKLKLLQSQLSLYESDMISDKGSTLHISNKEMRQQTLKHSCTSIKDDIHNLLPEMEGNNYIPAIMMVANSVTNICSHLGFSSQLNNGIISELEVICQKIVVMQETNKSLQSQIMTKNYDLNKFKEQYQNLLQEFKENYINKNQLLIKENYDLQNKCDASTAALESVKQQYLLSCDYLISEMGLCLEDTSNFSLFDTITRSISAIKQQLYMMSSLSYDEDSEFPNVSDNQPLFQQLISLNEKIIQSITFCEQYRDYNQNQANIIQLLEEQVYNQKSEISDMESNIQKLCQYSQKVQSIIQSLVPKSQDAATINLFELQINQIIKSISTVLNCDDCCLYDLVNQLLQSYDQLGQNLNTQQQTINQLNEIVFVQQQQCQQSSLTIPTRISEIRNILKNLLSLSKGFQAEKYITQLQQLITTLLSKYQSIYISFTDQSHLVQNLADQIRVLKLQVQPNPVEQQNEVNIILNMKSEIVNTKQKITQLSAIFNIFKQDLNIIIQQSIDCFSVLPLKFQTMFRNDCSYMKNQLLQLKQDFLPKLINFDNLNNCFRFTIQLTLSLNQQVKQMESFFGTSQQLLKQNIITISNLNEQVEQKNMSIQQQYNEINSMHQNIQAKDSSIKLLSESNNVLNQNLQSIKQQNYTLSNQNQQMNQVHFVLQQRADDSESLIQQLKLNEEAFRDNLHLSTSVCIQDLKRLLIEQKHQFLNLVPDWQQLQQLISIQLQHLNQRNLEYSNCMEGIQYLKQELNIDIDFSDKISFLSVIQQLSNNYKINKNLKVDDCLADQFPQNLLETEIENILQLLQEEFNIEMEFQSNTSICQKIRLLLDYFKLSLGFKVDHYLANQIINE